MAAQTSTDRRRALRGSNVDRVSRSLIVASAFAMIVFLGVWVLLPFKEQIVVRVHIPEHARTVLPEPLPEAPPAVQVAPPPLAQQNLTVQRVVERHSDEPNIEPNPVPPPRRLRESEPDPDAGKAGRARAEEATAKLASATSALDGALNGLSSALATATAGTGEPTRGRRSRNVRSGRADYEVASNPQGPAGATADLEHSGVQGSRVAIGTLAAAPTEANDNESGASASGSAPGVYRTNASLLAVIQRYAPGIQYCYETELKRDPSLRGKLVVSMSVAPSGEVTDVTVVQNTVRSDRLAGCALSQIRDWKFPPIPSGVTTFQTPFVFSPPN